MSKKRITVNVSENVDAIRLQIERETGVVFSYVQLIDFLINFYRKNSVKTTWNNKITDGAKN
jgi:hypothetical protein